jgi:hypothetical protein
VALGPDDAIALLRLLSTDVREAVVLAPGGAVLAGDAELAKSLQAPDVLVEAGPLATVAVRTGPHAVEALVRTDLRRAAAAIGQ